LTAGRDSILLRLEGDNHRANRDAIGAVVRVWLEGGTKLLRQVVHGGHAGKQSDFAVHFGLGEAKGVVELEVVWPDAERTIQRFTDVAAGRYTLRMGEDLETAAGD